MTYNHKKYIFIYLYNDILWNLQFFHWKSLVLLKFWNSWNWRFLQFWFFYKIKTKGSSLIKFSKAYLEVIHRIKPPTEWWRPLNILRKGHKCTPHKTCKFPTTWRHLTLHALHLVNEWVLQLMYWTRSRGMPVSDVKSKIGTVVPRQVQHSLY